MVWTFAESPARIAAKKSLVSMQAPVWTEEVDCECQTVDRIVPRQRPHASPILLFLWMARRYRDRTEVRHRLARYASGGATGAQRGIARLVDLVDFPDRRKSPRF